MAKYSWSETFISLEGEFLFQGYPTVYVRFARCNFTCQKFNNPDNVKITNEVLGFNPKDYNKLSDVPLITMGCDSLYAHDKRFEHLWHTGDENDLATELVSLLPDKKWIHPITGLPYICSITGGEPTLYQKTLPSLLNHPLMNDLKLLLIETNGSVPLSDSFIFELNYWSSCQENRRIIWSNSPKLSASGEKWERAICPKVILAQNKVYESTQYFKFVCGPRKEDFDEVEKAMNEFYDVGILKSVPVGIMPESCTSQQQNEIAVQVADMCIKRGYVYVARLQNYLWGNAIGT